MIANFTNYVMSFYGDKGLYPFSFTEIEVEAATVIYKASLSSQGKEFVGDSVDRENVRDIVLNYRKSLKAKQN
jgi:hypothetical protein